MKRRSILAVLGGSLVGGLSGCQESEESRKLGQTVEHQALSVTPDEYTTANRVTYDISDSQATPSENAPKGATFLLTHISVKHTGENKQQFPSRGLFSPSKKDRINHSYKGERLSIPDNEDSSRAYIINGNRLPNYIHKLSVNDMMSPVYSGSASGWLINVIPSGFTPSEAKAKITWGGETFSWLFTESAKVSHREASNK